MKSDLAFMVAERFWSGATGTWRRKNNMAQTGVACTKLLSHIIHLSDLDLATGMKDLVELIECGKRASTVSCHKFCACDRERWNINVKQRNSIRRET